MEIEINLVHLLKMGASQPDRAWKAELPAVSCIRFGEVSVIMLDRTNPRPDDSERAIGVGSSPLPAPR